MADRIKALAYFKEGGSQEIVFQFEPGFFSKGQWHLYKSGFGLTKIDDFTPMEISPTSDISRLKGLVGAAFRKTVTELRFQ